MSTPPNQSRFVWYDLMSPDREASKSFYGEVAGWSAAPFGGPESGYDMFSAGEAGVGGVADLTAELKAMNVPPHWLGYVCVEDTDATATRAEKLGGKVMKAPFDVPEVGGIAVLVDPQGAALGIYTPANPEDKRSEDVEAGHFCWSELATTDREGALGFYGELFGWAKTESMDTPNGGVYQMFKAPGLERSNGGVIDKPDMVPVSMWLYYVKVDDLDGALATTKKLGGQVVNGPMEVPDGNRVAQCMDPQGAAFALFGK